MNGNGFQLAVPARNSGGKIPQTVEKALVGGYAEAGGALLVVNGSDQYAACGADPAQIAAVALTPGGTDSTGFNILGKKEFPPGYMQGILIQGQKFNAPYIGALPAAPGGQYGVIRDSDGVWKVDFNEIVNAVLQYLGVPDFNPSLADASEPFVMIQFLDEIVQMV